MCLTFFVEIVMFLNVPAWFCMSFVCFSNVYFTNWLVSL